MRMEGGESHRRKKLKKSKEKKSKQNGKREAAETHASQSINRDHAVAVGLGVGATAEGMVGGAEEIRKKKKRKKKRPLEQELEEGAPGGKGLDGANAYASKTKKKKVKQESQVGEKPGL